MYAEHRAKLLANMPQLKFTYFDIRGRGEIIRLCFVAGGVKYEDIRVEHKDWPALKPKTPYGSIPILRVGDVVLAESIAIARYAAKEAGLGGKDNLESAIIDSYVDTFIDLREKVFASLFAKDSAEKEAESKKLFGETIPGRMTQVEARLKGGNKFLMGDKMTFADIALFSVYDNFVKNADITKGFKNLSTVVDNVKSNPKIKEYLSKRKETDI